jgi:ketosteroid isomerase-like protein
MVRIFTAMLAASLVAAASANASEETDVMKVVHQWVNNFTTVGIDPALCAEQTSIVDDFPPFAWHSPDACSKWLSDYHALLKANELTGASFVLIKPQQLQVTGNHAYFVSRAKLSYKQKGTLMKQTALETLALEKGSTGWRVIGEAWASTSEAVPTNSATTSK